MRECYPPGFARKAKPGLAREPTSEPPRLTPKGRLGDLPEFSDNQWLTLGPRVPMAAPHPMKYLSQPFFASSRTDAP